MRFGIKKGIEEQMTQITNKNKNDMGFAAENIVKICLHRNECTCSRFYPLS